ncbi:MAG: hypothetical protein Q8J74_00790 [Candidatus Didemnitutus sp.]|nr:hypothetical protein [Candidatus Didemnitutus sp.]
MKNLLLILSLLLAAVAQAQTGAVTKSTASGTLNDLTTDLQVPTGKTMAVKSGGTLNGAGTFNFSLGTLTLADTQVGWAKVDKTGSTLADLPTRLFADLQSKPNTISGYGITNGAAIDSWGVLTRASGFDTFVATPSGANLAGLLTTALPVSKGGTGIATVALGDVLYGAGANNLAPLAGNVSTTMAVLTQTGNGTTSAPPVWTPTTGLQIVFRQGSDAERQTVIFANGEAVWTTDTKQVFVGDGVTLGGRLASLGSGNVAVAGRLSITYTGTPVVPLLLPLVPPMIVVPASPVSGPVTYAAPGVAAILTFAYTESSLPGYLTSLSFNDLAVVTTNFTPNSMAALTTLSLPELVDVGGSFSPSTMATLTTLSLPKLATVAGSFAPDTMAALTTLSLPELVAVGGGFSPSFMASLTTLSLPKLTRVVGAFSPGNMAALTTLSIPELVTVGGIFGPSSMSALITLTAPKLVTVRGTFNPGAMAALTTLSLPELVTVSGTFSPSSVALLTTLSAPKLATVGGNFNPSWMAALTTISLPQLTIITGTCNPSNMALLATFSLPAMVSYGSTISIPSASMGNVSSVTLGTIGTLKSISGTTITLSGLKIPSANVNAILALLVSLDGTNGTTLWGSGKTITINGGTNGAPTGQGLTDKATLQGRGATITTN